MVARSLEPEGRPSRTADIPAFSCDRRQLGRRRSAQRFCDGVIPMGLDEGLQPEARVERGPLPCEAPQARK
jgi:hypothetical protein